MLKCHDVCDQHLPIWIVHIAVNQISESLTLEYSLDFYILLQEIWEIFHFTHTHNWRVLFDVATTLPYLFISRLWSGKHFWSNSFFGPNGPSFPVFVVATGLASNSYFISLLYIIWHEIFFTREFRNNLPLFGHLLRKVVEISICLLFTCLFFF